MFGKPEPGILLDLCAHHGLSPDQLAMVGDRIYTEVAKAQKAGSLAVLVLIRRNRVHRNA